MNRFFVRIVVSVIVSAFLCGCGGSGGGGSSYRYSIQDLGTLPNGTCSAAASINDAGQVLILSNKNGEPDYPGHPAIWDNGTLTDLGYQDTDAIFYDISGTGQVAGGLGRQAIVLQNGQVNAFEVTPGCIRSSFSAMNEYGQGVVVSILPDGASSKPHSFIWQTGNITDIGSFSGTDINEQGDVCGTLQVGHDKHACLWKNGVLTDLATLDGRLETATALNDSGQVIGRLESTAGRRAFLWQSGSVTDLGTPDPAYPEVSVNDINDKGQVIGIANGGPGKLLAFLWENGTNVSLDKLIPPDSGWQLINANEIDDQGRIVGFGWHNGKQRAYLMIPNG